MPRFSLQPGIDNFAPPVGTKKYSLLKNILESPESKMS
jgi:hypothetical protein